MANTKQTSTGGLDPDIVAQFIANVAWLNHEDTGLAFCCNIEAVTPEWATAMLYKGFSPGEALAYLIAQGTEPPAIDTLIQRFRMFQNIADETRKLLDATLRRCHPYQPGDILRITTPRCRFTSNDFTELEALTPLIEIVLVEHLEVHKSSTTQVPDSVIEILHGVVPTPRQDKLRFSLKARYRGIPDTCEVEKIGRQEGDLKALRMAEITADARNLYPEKLGDANGSH